MLYTIAPQPAERGNPYSFVGTCIPRQLSDHLAHGGPVLSNMVESPQPLKPAARPPRPAPPQVASIPVELRHRAQWVCWRYENPDPGTGEAPTERKWKKVPYRPDGLPASVSDRRTWTSFTSALGALETKDFDGIGYVFSAGDPYTGIDFDGCVCDGVPDPLTSERLALVSSYSEFSVSGSGVHTIANARLPAGRRHGAGVEMYDSRRFIVFTGNRVPGTPATIELRQYQIDALHQEVFEGDKGSSPQPRSTRPARARTVGKLRPGSVVWAQLPDDDRLLELALTAKDSDEFRRL